MMNKETSAEYLINEYCKVMILPYGDGEFGMVFIEPLREIWPAIDYQGVRTIPEESLTYYDRNIETGVTTDSTMRALTKVNWRAWLKGFKKSHLEICVPKYLIQTQDDMTGIMKNSSWQYLFASDAAYSRMSPNLGIYMAKAIQSGMIKVDELGTVAAATWLLVFADSLDPGLCLNRPFLFAVVHEKSGLIIMLGRLSDPIWPADRETEN